MTNMIVYLPGVNPSIPPKKVIDMIGILITQKRRNQVIVNVEQHTH